MNKAQKSAELDRRAENIIRLRPIADRERSVPCQHVKCRTRTFNNNALCNDHQPNDAA